MKKTCFRKKLWFFLVLFTVVFGIIYFRLYNIQIKRHPYYQAKQQNYKYVTHTKVRRNILDRNSEVLATNARVVEATFFLHNNRVIEIVDASSRLGFFEQLVKYIPFWEVDTEYIDLGAFNEGLKERLSARFPAFSSERVYGNRPVLVLRNLPLSMKEQIRLIVEEESRKFVSAYQPEIQPRVRRILRRHIVQNLRTDVNARRMYLFERTACHVLGYMNMEGPQKGAEFFLDPIISQENISVPRNTFKVTQAQTREVEECSEKGDVILTIDMDIQRNVERILRKNLERVHAPKGFVIVMDPNNGEIIALANFPDYNPQKISLYYQTSLNHERFRNIALEEPFEPGSIMKVFPIAAAIEEELVDIDTEYDLKNGYWYIPDMRKQVRDSHPRDKGNISDILKYSSNIGTVKVARELGPALLYEYLLALQLEENYNIYAHNQHSIVQPQRRRGIYPLSRWTRQSLAMVPMGHEVAFSGIQLLASFNALVNGGIYYSPRVVQSMINDDGETVKFDNYISRRVLSPSTSDKMRTVMQAATEYHPEYEKRGTGSQARFINHPHITTGGKTGTAQYFDRDSGSYHSSRYISSFMGFFPVEEPQYTILVTVFFPAFRYRYGGECAAPVFREIGEMIVELQEDESGRQ